MSHGANQMTRVDTIEQKIDKVAASSIAVSSDGGMEVKTMGQAMEFAKLMAISDKAVPAYLRGNVGACLAVTMRGMEWGINPFAIANKTYVVNDRIAFESSLYQAVLTRRAPIKGRLKSEYTGQGAKRQCRIYAELLDGDKVDYTSPETGGIKPKNSPLWQNDPDQQLYYFSVRGFARRHFEDVMMGVYTVDEMQDARDVVTTSQRGTAGVLDKLTARPVSEGQSFDPNPDYTPPAGETIDADTGEVTEPDTSDADAEPPAPDYSTWSTTLQEITAAAMNSNMDDVWARVDRWKLVAGVKGKEEKTTVDQRRRLVEAVRAGKLGTDGKIAD